MTTGELIREARKKKGLTQRELGELLGMSDVGVAQWEKGLRNPRLETRQRIAKALDIDITALMSDSEREDYFDLFGTEQERIQLALGEIKRGTPKDLRMRWTAALPNVGSAKPGNSGPRYGEAFRMGVTQRRGKAGKAA